MYRNTLFIIVTFATASTLSFAGRNFDKYAKNSTHLHSDKRLARQMAIQHNRNQINRASQADKKAQYENHRANQNDIIVNQNDHIAINIQLFNQVFPNLHIT